MTEKLHQEKQDILHNSLRKLNAAMIAHNEPEQLEKIVNAMEKILTLMKTHNF